MKKLYLFLLTVTGIQLHAQNLHDALRYSEEHLQGTARFKGTNGAFGAIGGDFSALAQNPAGGAIFSGSEINFSFGDFSKKNTINFFSSQNSQRNSNFNASQFGLVLTLKNTPKDNWKRINFAFNYQNTQNFEINEFLLKGEISSENLGDYFANAANGISQQNLLLVNYKDNQVSERFSLSDVYDDMRHSPNPFRYRNALLGHYTGMITPKIGRDEISVTDSDQTADAILKETSYLPNTGKTAIVSYEKLTDGKNSRYNFNISGQYADHIFWGLNLNSHSVDYTEKTIHQENYLGESPIKSASFENELHASGKGFSFQLGVIAKLEKNWRFGLSYQSPTWYTIQEEFSQKLRTLTAQGQTIYANPQIIALYPEYKFRSPGAWQGSVAYFFGKRGFINLDYIYKGYGNLHFSSHQLKAENNLIEQELGDTSQIRIGGEYRIKALSFRAGYRFAQSPFRGQTKYIGNLNGFSIGTGYTFGGLRFDISYDISNQNNQIQLYENGLNTPHLSKNTHQNLLFTISTKIF